MEAVELLPPPPSTSPDIRVNGKLWLMSSLVKYDGPVLIGSKTVCIDELFQMIFCP